jgi:hypothetical protein
LHYDRYSAIEQSGKLFKVQYIHRAVRYNRTHGRLQLAQICRTVNINNKKQNKKLNSLATWKTVQSELFKPIKKDSRYHIPSHMLFLYTGTVYLQYIYSVYMCVYMYVDIPYLYKELHVQ